MTDAEILKKAIEKYAVYPNGEVVNLKSGKKLKPHYDGIRYPYISVYMGNGVTKKLNVHRFVASVFLPLPSDSTLTQVNHKNGDHKDNRVENLEWCTPSYNVSDGFKRGRIIWNKGNASKERIYGYCKKYPRQIFWILTSNDFYFAKAFWGESIEGYRDEALGEDGNPLRIWQYQLRKMVLEPEPIKYLEKFI